MSELYNRIEKLCKKSGITVTEMCRQADVPRGNLTDLKMGRQTGLSAKNMDKIASFFGVTVSQLLNADADSPIVYCNGCGLHYNSEDPEEVAQHTERHIAWKRAVNKFGFCWPYSFREERKIKARAQLASQSTSDDDSLEAQITIFKALFSRSLESSGYDLNHISFNDYVAMLLNQQSWKKDIEPHLYMKLSSQYGVKKGIPEGSYYKIEKAPSITGERELEDDFLYAMSQEAPYLSERSKDQLRAMAEFLRKQDEKEK